MSRRIPACVAAVVALGACGGDEPSRSDAMAAVADVAVPAFEAFAADAAATVAAVDAACADPTDETVGDALAAVDAARAGWLATEAMWTGPVMERRAPAIVDWKVDVAGVEELVTGDDELTPEVIARNVGADNRGLLALRGLLSRDDAVELLADDRWCAYVTSVAGAVAAQADAVVADWTVSFEGGPPFREVVADPEQAQEWLSMYVNDDINLARRVREQGDEGDVPVADLAADRAAQLSGLAAVTTALAPLLGDELATRLDGELDAALAAFESGDLEGGRALADAVDKTLTTDVAGRLDVTVGFSDADGDGSS